MMSDGVQDQAYLEELIALICLGTLFALLKLYSCCFLSGAYKQGLELNERQDPLSQATRVLQAPRLQTVNRSVQTLVPEVLNYSPPRVRNIKIEREIDQCTISTQTFLYPAKFVVQSEL